MQPAKACRTSKSAPFASVSAAARASHAASIAVASRSGANLVEQLDGAARPHRPLAEQPAHDARRALAVAERREGREQVEHDLVVVAGVERDVRAARIRDGAQHVERLIAIERRDLDRDHLRNLGEAAPELVAEHAPADRRLQVESEQRKHLADGAAVLEQLPLRCVVERAEAEERGVVAEVVREAGFGDRLLVLAAHAGDEREGARIGAQRLGRGLGREREHGARRPCFGSRISNCVVCTPTAMPPAPAAT